MTDPVLTENKLFHWLALGIGGLMSSLMLWFAYTVQQTSTTLNVMAEHVTNIDKKIDDGFVGMGKHMDDYDMRLRINENNIVDLKDRVQANDGRLSILEGRHK